MLQGRWGDKKRGRCNNKFQDLHHCYRFTAGHRYIYGYISISVHPVVMGKGELRRDIRIVATKLQGFYVSVRSTVINGPRFSMGCQGNQGGKDTEGLIKT